MKKTITSLAILASASSAFALIGPGPAPKPKNVCLSTWTGQHGEVYVGDCDQSYANRLHGLPLQKNGCAANQASLRSFKVQVKACPTYVQL